MASNDIIIVGTKAYRQQVLNQLQALTSQKLSFTRGGKIEMSGTPSGGPKPVGTDLVSTLVSSKHTTVIELGESKEKGNGTKFKDKTAAYGETSGGTSSNIRFDPNNLENSELGVKNFDGTTGRPAQIGLAHELAHVVDGVNGTATNETIIDPDNRSREVKPMTKDEFKIRTKVENPIRE